MKTYRMKLIFYLQIKIKGFFKLILHFRCVWPDMPKSPKITSSLFLCNISKKKRDMKSIFYMQINIKVSYKLISTLWVSKFPTR